MNGDGAPKTARADAVLATLGYSKRPGRSGLPLKTFVLYGAGAILLGFVGLALLIRLLTARPPESEHARAASAGSAVPAPAPAAAPRAIEYPTASAGRPSGVSGATAPPPEAPPIVEASEPPPAPREQQLTPPYFSDPRQGRSCRRRPQNRRPRQSDSRPRRPLRVRHRPLPVLHPHRVPRRRLQLRHRLILALHQPPSARHPPSPHVRRHHRLNRRRLAPARPARSFRSGALLSAHRRLRQHPDALPGASRARTPPAPKCTTTSVCCMRIAASSTMR